MTTIDQATDKLVKAIGSGKLDGSLGRIQAAVAARQQQVRAQSGIRVRIRSDSLIRPLYLSGCEGTLGNKRGSRYEFFPNPGTRAAQRSQGRPWKIRWNAFDTDSQNRIVDAAQGRYGDGDIRWT